MSIEEFLEEWRDESPYVRVQTSGSTGAPKQMLVEKRRMLASARRTNDFLGLQPGDTALLCMSLDYIAGKMMVVRALERNLKLICVEPSGHPMKQRDGSFVTSASDVTKEPSPCYTFAAMVPMQVYLIRLRVKTGRAPICVATRCPRKRRLFAVSEPILRAAKMSDKDFALH